MNVRLAIIALIVNAVVATEARAQTVAPSPSPVSTAVPTKLARMISEQLLAGRQVQCTRDSEVFYEACLLYQGAFGYWRGTSFTPNCGDGLSNGLRPLSPEQLAEKALQAPANTCFASVYAVAVANTVPILVSTLNQWFQRVLRDGYENPGSDAERCLTLRYGLCGNHTSLALALFEEAGLTARPVQVFYENKGLRLNHIAPEVRIGDEYRYVDTTYGAYWTKRDRAASFDLATLDEVRAMRNPSKRAVWNAALAPYSIPRTTAAAEYDPFDYLSASNASIIRGYQGTIRLAFNGLSGSEPFKDIPNYLGDNQNDGRSAGVDFAIAAARGRYEIKLRTLATAVTNFAPASVCVNDVCQFAPAEAGELTFAVKDPRRLHIQSEADAAYVVMESLSWKRLN